MQNRLSKYQLACRFEESGMFKAAFSIFRECLEDSTIEQGDLMFKCGWCLENIEDSDRNISISYYFNAGRRATDSVCRMNGFFRAGWLLMHFNRNEEAIEAFAKSIQIGDANCVYNSIYREAMYWCAASLERENQILKAIQLYKTVSLQSHLLKPESQYREIRCNVAVGRYYEALQLCKRFDQKPPAEFSTDRYSELKELVKKEQTILLTFFN
jgi:tetratricopeptide (TPR) repeat protein